MALYESVFIARQDVSSSQVDALADSFQKIIEDGGGQVAKREYWGLRSLAYKIKKNRKGHYVLFNIDAPSEAVLEYERNMKLNEDILRYMTLRVDELDPEPSVVMQGRGRGDRGERGGRRFEERPRDGDRRPQAGASEAAKPAETKTAEPVKSDAAKPDAEAADEKAPKTAAKTAEKTDGDKKDDGEKKDAKPAKSEKPAPDDKKSDDKKAKKAEPAEPDAPAKEDKKPASAKKAAATKKGEEA